jgi:transglutaminase-like putative cysteine protease
MNRYRLVHVTEFHYDGPVTESYNEVRLRPRHDERQSCLSISSTC